jgi:hypothetical protein
MEKDTKFYQIRNNKTGEMKSAGLWNFSKRGGKVWTTSAAFHNMINMHVEHVRCVSKLKRPDCFNDWSVIVTDNNGREEYPALQYSRFKKLLNVED